MTWFKVDDSFHSHSKVLAAPPAALGLWVVAGSWSSKNLSDGFVPDHVLPRLLPDAATLAEQLVTAGLWRRTKRGHRFHDWLDFNPPAKQINAERKAARERMRAVRENRKRPGGTPNGSGEQKPNVRSRFGDPDPTRPELPNGSSGSGERAPPVRLRAVADWCGRCNKNTRHDVDDRDRSIPCPRCHPEAAA